MNLQVQEVAVLVHSLGLPIRILELFGIFELFGFFDFFRFSLEDFKGSEESEEFKDSDGVLSFQNHPPCPSFRVLTPKASRARLSAVLLSPKSWPCLMLFSALTSPSFSSSRKNSMASSFLVSRVADARPNTSAA